MLDFDISFYIRVIRKWLWLALLVGAIVGAAAYFVLNSRADEYEARTLVAVGTFLGNPDPGLEDVRLAQELTPTYAQVAETRRVLEPVIETLGLDADVGLLRRAIETESIPDTSLFVLVVTWSDPDTAAAIANEVARQLILSNPSNLSPALQNQVDLSQEQIDLLTTQIAGLREQLLTLDDRIDDAELDVTEAQDELAIAEANLEAAEIAVEEAAASAPPTDDTEATEEAAGDADAEATEESEDAVTGTDAEDEESDVDSDAEDEDEEAQDDADAEATEADADTEADTEVTGDTVVVGAEATEEAVLADAEATEEVEDDEPEVDAAEDEEAIGDTDAETAEEEILADAEAAEEDDAADAEAAEEAIFADADAAEEEPILDEPLVDPLQVELEAAELALVDAETNLNTAQARLDGLLTQRSNVIGQINQATATIAQLSATITQIQQRTNALVLQQEAAPPTSPVGRSTLLLTLVAAVGATGLVGVAMLLLESTDTSFRSERRIEHMLELPIRGTVELGSRRQLAQAKLESRLQEPYQMLRANLVFSDSSTDTPIYIFSSPTNTERRSRVLGNLALAAAESGSHVLVLDADLRQPELSNTLQLSNEHGLAEYLTASPDILDDPKQFSEVREQITQREVSENLDVIPGGTSTQNPIRLLESKMMRELLERLRHDDYDFIIVNTPPILSYPDASTLASLTGIEVMLILEHARSRSENAVAALDQVQQVGGELNGVIYVR